jgi:hypothetical protein
MHTSADPYFLQFLPIQVGSGVQQSFLDLEITAFPMGVSSGAKECLRGRWKHGLGEACSRINLTPFECKAMDRTLRMGLPAYVIDRTTGGKQPFSREQISALRLELKLLHQRTTRRLDHTERKEPI